MDKQDPAFNSISVLDHPSKKSQFILQLLSNRAIAPLRAKNQEFRQNPSLGIEQIYFKEYRIETQPIIWD
ncbi:hypothetical protein PCC7424_4127 [Gloeothece citriformis PCC 7424]|uniref:Uncharacterized protein n=1 Tax=Gloeothece citriformis (strain PCC 7424) TaxID=65393 RepID=B7KLC6_GLOC7|nr:hypothetical protein [Gloeothece citriformis]ACK72498.1 hypothetical protein PCC7424_4127 [Gloeothece citriformis PCC 7424]